MLPRSTSKKVSSLNREPAPKPDPQEPGPVTLKNNYGYNMDGRRYTKELTEQPKRYASPPAQEVNADLSPGLPPSEDTVNGNTKS